MGSPKWDGPYKVLKRGEHTFLLALGLDELGRKKSEEIALSRLKPAYYDEDGGPESTPVRKVPGRKPAKSMILPPPGGTTTPVLEQASQESPPPVMEQATQETQETYAQATARQGASPILTTTTRSGRIVKHVVDNRTAR